MSTFLLSFQSIFPVSCLNSGTDSLDFDLTLGVATDAPRFKQHNYYEDSYLDRTDDLLPDSSSADEVEEFRALKSRRKIKRLLTETIRDLLDED